MKKSENGFEDFLLFEEILDQREEEEKAQAAKRAADVPDAVHAAGQLAAQMAKQIAAQAIERITGHATNRDGIPASKRVSECTAERDEDMYYEIEYGTTPFPGVGKFVKKPQRVEAVETVEKVEKDAIRERFQQMREIARAKRTYPYGGSRFFERQSMYENAEIFYEQGRFMESFEDEYPDYAPYSSWFPNYQMMGYEQLRTYFSWRTKVRKGMIAETELSYAYLYMYELLNNIGVADPQEGLEQLTLFWKTYREYDDSIDHYLIRWVKDYHIYYELPVSFQEFVRENHLEVCYPRLTETGAFELYCSISRYDIRKSSFYKGEWVPLIQDCFLATISHIRQELEAHHMDFDEIVFRPTKNMSAWTPFPKALFKPWKQQRDRRVVFSENEIYVCRQNRWSFSTVLTSENGKALVGYVMKQMESELRKAVKYRHKLTASLNGINPVLLVELSEKGIPLPQLVTDAVTAFYREATKTVVTVDPESLARIRREAFETQEKLTVPEDEVEMEPSAVPEARTMQEPFAVQKSSAAAEPRTVQEPSAVQELSALQESPVVPAPFAAADTPWTALAQALSPNERETLARLVEGETDLRPLADRFGVMLEVLLDGINEKAMDWIGDSLLDEEGMIYEDYFEQVKEMVNEQ